MLWANEPDSGLLGAGPSLTEQWGGAPVPGSPRAGAQVPRGLALPRGRLL